MNGEPTELADRRREPSRRGDERSTLAGWLDYHRATLQLKCEGLSNQALRTAAVAPSSLTLLGLVRHLSEVERSWFRRTMAGEVAPPLYYDEIHPGADFDVEHLSDAAVVQAFDRWSIECDYARRFTAAAPSLDMLGRQRRGFQVSLRWVLTHMIEEYARHNGHADLLRERLDGQVGA